MAAGLRKCVSGMVLEGIRVSEVNRYLRAISNPVANFRSLVRIMRTFRNWPSLTIQYVLKSDQATPLEARFRHGTTLLLHDRAELSNLWAIFGRDEYPLFEEDRTIIDIGANVGLFTIFAAQRLPHARITAFEPVHSTFQTLAENVSAARLKADVSLVNAGVAGSDGRKLIYLGSSSDLASLYPNSESQEKEWIETRDINRVLQNHGDEISLLKMDCEGAEWEILDCARPELLQKVGRIYVEFHGVTPQKMRAALAILAQFGFRVEHILRHGAGETAVVRASRVPHPNPQQSKQRIAESVARSA